MLQNQEVIQYVVHSQQGSNIRNNWYYEEMQLKVFLDLTNTSDIQINCRKNGYDCTYRKSSDSCLGSVIDIVYFGTFLDRWYWQLDYGSKLTIVSLLSLTVDLCTF